ncbi:MAG: ATP-binding cassette domain-containing protein [Proteobacteria bacterium]|nr:ATP-binding cassette domain-containing protein [Pseudomonadota bacterium]
MQDCLNDVKKVSVLRGMDKNGMPEELEKLEIQAGSTLAVVGATGSGKSELLSDIEQMAFQDTGSKRRILINDNLPATGFYDGRLVAQLSQTMNFVMDASVERFLHLHAESRGRKENDLVEKTLDTANTLCGEPIKPGDSLQVLSGGQSRALMIADIALISDAPVVLIDEIENAGINKLQALNVLSGSKKPIIIASHDPLLILMAEKRVVMKNGGMRLVLETSQQESLILENLKKTDVLLSKITDELRNGNALNSNLKESLI